MSSAPASDPRDTAAVEEPPHSFLRTLARLGPGLIIAGSIVGSGELIATTKTGAQAGMSLLWLIVIGCVIKVFVQIELGRHTVTHGETTLAAINRVPGPRLRVNWIVWFWLAMMAASTAQLGGIVQGVGQSLALAAPLSGDFRDAINLPTAGDLLAIQAARYAIPSDLPRDDPRILQAQEEYRRLSQLLVDVQAGQFADDFPQAQAAAIGATEARLRFEAAEAGNETPAELERLRNDFRRREYEVRRFVEPYTLDDKIWAGIATFITILLLYLGRYSLVQNVTTAMVALFTFVILATVIGLHVQTSQPELRISLADWGHGFGWPRTSGVLKNPLTTALATFGIIGVGAAELVAYPYWCLEKGYAKFTGPRSDDPGWAHRARGWIRVMRIDAGLSLVVYTLATVAFYVLGAVVLFRRELDPSGMRTVATLRQQFEPIFGSFGGAVFLIGAVAVLYSTFLVASAGNARALADSFILLRLPKCDEARRQRAVSLLCVALPLVSYAICLGGYDPVALVLFAGVMQALMFPLLGIAAVWLRFRDCDPRLRPSKLGDGLLLLSLVAALIAGGWVAWTQLQQLFS